MGMQIPSTRAMMKSARSNGKLIDYERAEFLDVLQTCAVSFGKSSSFSKATVLAAPDLATAKGILSHAGSDEDGKNLVRQFVAGLNKKYQTRVTNNDSDNLIDFTPWADKYAFDSKSHPDAVAIPQDYWGYVVQPGDPINNWGKTLTDNATIDALRGEYEPLGVDYGFGLIVSPYDDRGKGEERGFVLRPGYGAERKTYAERYPQNVSNAQIAFENGKITGINGPESELRALTMLKKQFDDAMRSGDSTTRAAAQMYDNYLQYLLPTWYNPRSYHLNSYGNVALRSPEQVMHPMHGMPGSSFWEETLHGIDNTAGANMGDTFVEDHLSVENPIIFSGLQDDFLNKFGGDPEKILEHANDIIQGWSKPGGGRYADDHEYLELLNHMYNIGTEGKDAPGALGSFANHPVGKHSWGSSGTSATLPEAFNSLTNGRMTGNKKGVERIRQNMPNADKAAGELYKQANDLHADEAEKKDFDLGIA